MSEEHQHLVFWEYIICFQPHRYAEVLSQVFLVQPQSVIIQPDSTALEAFFNILRCTAFIHKGIIAACPCLHRRCVVSALAVGETVFKGEGSCLEPFRLANVSQIILLDFLSRRRRIVNLHVIDKTAEYHILPEVHADIDIAVFLSQRMVCITASDLNSVQICSHCRICSGDRHLMPVCIDICCSKRRVGAVPVSIRPELAQFRTFAIKRSAGEGHPLFRVIVAQEGDNFVFLKYSIRFYPKRYGEAVA